MRAFLLRPWPAGSRAGMPALPRWGWADAEQQCMLPRLVDWVLRPPDARTCSQLGVDFNERRQAWDLTLAEGVQRRPAWVDETDLLAFARAVGQGVFSGCLLPRGAPCSCLARRRVT